MASATPVKTRELRGLQPDGACHARPAEAAVPVGILREVLLVVRLGVVEGARRRDLGGALAVPGLRELGLEHLARRLGRLELLVGRRIDRGAVLRADVIALT